MRLLRVCALLMCLMLANSVFAGSRIRVACVGNSITYGVGVSDSLSESYPSVLGTLLGESYEVRAFAKSGATLLNRGHRPYIKERAYQEALAYRPDVVVIHLGVNDTDPRNWPNYGDEFIADYVSLIDSFKRVNPHVRVLVAEITPITERHPRFASGTYDWQLKIRDAIAVVADATGSQLIDFYTPLHSHPSMFPDAIHPNAQGAALMAEVAASAITGDYGGLQLSQMYSSNMILQRERPISIKGKANAGDRVEVRLGKRKASAITSAKGEWAVELPAMDAGTGYELIVETKERELSFDNVAIGEVWLLSGQSNMEWPLKWSATAAKELERAQDRDIRVYNMLSSVSTSAKAWSPEQVARVNSLDLFAPTQWQVLSQKSAADLSAIAYFVAQELSERLDGVPIGVIVNAVGGSTTESWIDRNTLERELMPILLNWRNNDFIQPWVRQRAGENLAAVEFDKFDRHPYEPSYLFESGIRPLDNYPIRGVMWYQGESNAHNVEAHEKLFELLVNSWRENWNSAQMPFYFVQLSSLSRPSWPAFRDSQRRLSERIEHTAMVVSSDRGDSLDVHPRHKRDIGLRLARVALAKEYGFDVESSGPLFKRAVESDGEVIVEFDHGRGMQSSDSEPISGFELAEFDGLYHPAKARVVGDGRIVVETKMVERPRYIRYSWQPFSRANLVNGDQLPASTFRAEVFEE